MRVRIITDRVFPHASEGEKIRAEAAFRGEYMKTAIRAKLPERLVADARAFVEAGWAGDFDELLAEALRRYLESHASSLAESFIKEDVKWGLRGRE